MPSWRASLQNAFYCIVNSDKFCHFFCNFFPLFASPLSFLSSVLLAFLFCFWTCVTSTVWRLYPGKLWHHPVTWFPRLLPAQPELHLDNWDLPWQRLAEEFTVNTCNSQFDSLTMLLPPNWVAFVFCWTSCLCKTGAEGGWSGATTPQDSSPLMSPLVEHSHQFDTTLFADAL